MILKLNCSQSIINKRLIEDCYNNKVKKLMLYYKKNGDFNMKKMQIFEPAMCCSTGLCGVGVDPELLRISTVLNSLQNKDIKVDRFNLSNAPQEFVTNSIVNNFINANGVDALPITLLDGEIVITGRYPKNEEFIQLLEIPMSYLGEKPKLVRAKIKKSSGCGCSDGNCC